MCVYICTYSLIGMVIVIINMLIIIVKVVAIYTYTYTYTYQLNNYIFCNIIQIYIDVDINYLFKSG